MIHPSIRSRPSSPWWNSREAARGDLRPLARRKAHADACVGRRTRCGDIVQEAQRSRGLETPTPQGWVQASCPGQLACTDVAATRLWYGAAWGRLRCSAREACDPASPPLARQRRAAGRAPAGEEPSPRTTRAAGPTALPTQPTGVPPRAVLRMPDSHGSTAGRGGGTPPSGNARPGLGPAATRSAPWGSPWGTTRGTVRHCPAAHSAACRLVTADRPFHEASPR
jgi:hypothetical protein